MPKQNQPKLFAVRIHAPNWAPGVWHLHLHTLYEDEGDARRAMKKQREYSESKHPEGKLSWKVAEAEPGDLPFAKIRKHKAGDLWPKKETPAPVVLESGQVIEGAPGAGGGRRGRKHEV